jgi:hypothetical protein
LTTFDNFWQLFDNFLTTFWQLVDNFLTTFWPFWQLFERFWQFFDNFFCILMVVASCRNKYYGTNFISAVPTSLLIAPGLWTIQFLFYFDCASQLWQQILWNKFYKRCAYFTPNCTWSPKYSVLVLILIDFLLEKVDLKKKIFNHSQLKR